MAGRVIQVGGVRLCAETFGERADPAILLIAGAASSMDAWEDPFCARLADGLRFVIRYDHRDTGQSTASPPGAPGYTGADLVGDALAILDALGVARAHLVGISAGGGIAQQLAIEHPERVATLTLLSTTLVGPRPAGVGDLPPPTEAMRAFMAADHPAPDWSDRAAVVEHVVAGERPYAGSLGFDEERVRARAERVVDRTLDVEASLTNHWILPEGPPSRAGVDSIEAPTLVLHGSDDPLFPLAHGEALAGAITGASLLRLPGVGHELPPPATWDVVVPAILRHTSGGWGPQGDRLAGRSLAAGDPTGWFDQLYRAGAAGEVPMPWRRTEAHPLLARWLRARPPGAVGRRAAVVGCGLGADAADLARRGWDTVGFDIAPEAIRLAGERFAGTGARFVLADLLDLPADWLRAFDLVVEIITVQALPDPPRHDAIVNVGRLVAPGGTLLVVALAGDDPADPEPQRPPWPLTRAEIDAFASDGLTPVAIEQVPDPRGTLEPRWLAEFQRV